MIAQDISDVFPAKQILKNFYRFWTTIGGIT